MRIFSKSYNEFHGIFFWYLSPRPNENPNSICSDSSRQASPSQILHRLHIHSSPPVLLITLDDKESRHEGDERMTRMAITVAKDGWIFPKRLQLGRGGLACVWVPPCGAESFRRSRPWRWRCSWDARSRWRGLPCKGIALGNLASQVANRDLTVHVHFIRCGILNVGMPSSRSSRCEQVHRHYQVPPEVYC